MTTAADINIPLSPETSGRFTDRRIIVGISGGIAAYKSATIVSHLVQDGAEVTVAMTDAATRFISTLTFQALSGQPVLQSSWEQGTLHDPQHIARARSTHLMLIAPCTMNMLARLAHGHAGDIVSLIAAGIDPMETPIVIAPSMNETMLNQASTRRNLAQCEADGFHLIAPEEGWQACRTLGAGRLAEPAIILDAMAAALSTG